MSMDDNDAWELRHDCTVLAHVRDRLRAQGVGDLGVQRCVRVVDRILAVQARKCGVCTSCLHVLDDVDAVSGRDGACMLCTHGILRRAPAPQLVLPEVIDIG